MLWNVLFSEENAANRPAKVQEVIEWFADVLKKILDFIGAEEGWIAAE